MRVSNPHYAPRVLDEPRIFPRLPGSSLQCRRVGREAAGHGRPNDKSQDQPVTAPQSGRRSGHDDMYFLEVLEFPNLEPKRM